MKTYLFIFALVLGCMLLPISPSEAMVVSPMVFGFSLFACGIAPSRSCEDCVTDERNKVVHVAFVRRGTVISTINSVTDLLAAELAGTAYIIRNVSGAYDGGAATFGKGLGKAVQRMLAKKHVLTFIDFSYTANANYWALMEQSANNYDVYFFTDTQVWIQTNAYISLEAKGTITDDNLTFIEGSVTATWSYISNPLNYPANVDLLATCQQLFNGDNLSFANTSGSTATIISGSGTTPDEIDMVHGVSVLNAKLNAGIAISSASVIEGALPAGIVLSYSGNFLTLTGTPTAAGTYNVIVKGSNPVGVAGQKAVKFIIS